MTRLHRLLAILAFTLATSAWLLDVRAPLAATSAERAGDYISAPDLAGRIVNGDAALRVVDLRGRQDFELLHVAGAAHMTLGDLRRAEMPRDARIVLYADDDERAAKGQRLLSARGHAHVAILRDGVDEWIARVLEPRLAVDATLAERAEFDRAVELSRFFGGMPRSNVPRSELPRGYWTGIPRTRSSRESTRQTIAGIRRRGC